MPDVYTAPELDEELWRAWKEKNRAKDHMRAARRTRWMGIASLIAIACAVIFSKFAS